MRMDRLAIRVVSCLLIASGAATARAQTPPQVSVLDTVAATGGGLADGEITNAAITQFLVTFDQAMADPSGNTNAEDVTNPANYLLVVEGINGSFDTVSCAGGSQADDVSIAVGTVTYTSGTTTATVPVNGGSALGDGTYRLFVCATLQSSGGDPLDGDGNGTGGDDFVTTFTVDRTPPRVDGVDTVAPTGGGLLEGEITNATITQIVLSFDEEMINPTGDSGTADVTNPANYLLVSAGGNGMVDTTGCGPVIGDDGSVSITFAAYDSSMDAVTLSVPSLTSAVYRLFACSTLEDLAGNQLDGDGNLSGGDDFVRNFEVDLIPPQVTSIESIPTSGDNLASPTIAQITALTVTFDEEVDDPSGNAGPNDVTNPANYLLVAAGVNESFDTASCVGGVQADDASIAINSVAYSSGTSIATVQVNGGTPLPDGDYRLLVCASTSIQDLAGNLLDGNGNGSGGDDYLQDFTVLPTVDLTVTINGLPATASPGVAVSYSIQIDNAGPNAIDELELTGAILPSLLSPVAVPTEGFFLGSTWSGISLAATGSVTLSVSGVIAPNAGGGTLTLNPNAQPVAPTVELDSGDNSPSRSVSLTPEADLEIFKTNSLTSVSPAIQNTYLLTVTNLGPASVTGAQILDTLPLQLEQIAAICTPGSLLELLETEVDARDDPGDPAGAVSGLARPTALALSPDGAHLYAVSASNSIVVFERDAITHRLSFLQALTGLVEIDGESDVLVSPDGKHVYVTGQSSDQVTVFTRDASSASGTYGELSSPSSIDPFGSGVGGAIGLGMSSDGRTVYVTGATLGAVQALERDPATGALTPLVGQLFEDGSGPINRLGGARDVVVTRDGEWVYVVAETDDALVVFDRNPATGELTFVEELFDGGNDSSVAMNVINTLGGARSVTVSPDGIDVYVAARGDGTIAAFRRTGSTHELLPALAIPLADVDSVAATPDGARVLASLTAGGEVAVLARAGDGSLTAETIVSSRNGSGDPLLEGLDGARALAIGAAGRSLYVGGLSFDSSPRGAIASFELRGRASCQSQPPPNPVEIDLLVDLGAGAQAVVSVVGRVKEDALGSTLINAAFVVAPLSVTDPAGGGDPPGGLCPNDLTDNNCSVDSDPIVRQADLAVTKTADETVVPGDASDPLVYTIEVRNLGPQSTVGSPPDVEFQDNLPTDLFETWSWYCQPSGAATCPSGTGPAAGVNALNPIVDQDIGTRTFDLPAASSDKLTFHVEAVVRSDAASLVADLALCDPGDTEPLCIPNTARADLAPASEFSDPDAGTGSPNHVANVETRLLQTSDLSVVKTGSYFPADVLRFDVPFTVAYGSPVTGRTLFSTSGATGLVSAINGGVLTLDSVTGTFLSGDVVYQVGGSGIFGLQFVGTLTADQTLSPSAIPRVTYRIEIENQGPSDVRGAVVTDTFPAGIDKPSIAWTCVVTPGGACRDSTGTTLGPVDVRNGDISNVEVDIPAGGIAVIAVEGNVAPSPPPILVNTATVDPPPGVSDPTLPNEGSATVVLQTRGDLAITKNDGKQSVVPGEEVRYSLVVSNNGPQDLFDAPVLDILPPEILEASWTCSAEPPKSGILTFLNAAASPDVSADAGAQIVLSPDGAHLYAAMGDGDALLVFERDLTEGLGFGGLFSTPLQQLTDGGGTEGLDGVTSVAISPDGRFAYAVGRDKGAVLVFFRDRLSTSPDYGELSLLQVLQGTTAKISTPIPGSLEMAGLDGAEVLAVSPDGKNVYVGGSTGDKALVVFARDSGSGLLLSRDQVLQDDSAALVDIGVATPNLDGISALAFTPTGDFLYVATAADGAIVPLARAGDGTLTPGTAILDDSSAGAATGLQGVAGLVVSADGLHVYSASPVESAISFFTRDEISGVLSEADVLVDGVTASSLAGVRSVAVAPDGQHLYAASESANAVAAFRRSTVTGGLTQLNFPELPGDEGRVTNGDPTAGGGVVAGLGQAVSVITSGDGANVYVAGRELGTVVALARGGSPPSFSFVSALKNGFGTPMVKGLSGPSSVAVTPSLGNHVYATGLGTDSVVVFQRDLDPESATYGQLSFLEVLQDDDAADPIPGAKIVDGLAGASAIAISPDRKFVYVTSRDEGALVVFERGDNPSDAASFGRLTPKAWFQDDDANATHAVLGAQVVDGLFGALGLVATNDYIYTTGPFDAAIGIFRRQGSTHTFVEAKINGVGTPEIGEPPVEGLQGVAALALTNDHLYAVGSFQDTLSVFERDPATGKLRFLEVHRDGLGNDGLDRALGIALSPDNEHVYVTGAFDNGVAVFQRDTFKGPPTDLNPGYGTLSFVQFVADGDSIVSGGEVIGEVDGLGGARNVVVSRDGSRVYVAGENDGALAVFSRNEDPASDSFGQLSFIEARKDGVDDVDGTDQAYALAVSPDDRHVYVAGLGDNAIATFFRTSGSNCSASGTGNVEDLIDIAAGGTVTYTVVGTLDPAAEGTTDPVTGTFASGVLTNRAFVLPPPGTEDPVGGIDPTTSNPATGPYVCPVSGDNNCDLDTSILTPRGDLELLKTNDQTTVVPGEETTYTITVSNAGPSNVRGARIEDDLLTDIFVDSTIEWSCLAIPTGRLDFVEVVADDELGIAALATPSGVAVSPDGAHVYATSLEQDSLTVLVRSGVDGSLVPLQRVAEGQTLGSATVSGLDGPSAVAISADGEWVYVTGRVSDSLVAFRRDPDPTSGTYGWVLEVVDVELDGQTDGESGLVVSGMDQPLALAVHPSQPLVYVAASNSDSVAVFRQQVGGALEFIESDFNGELDAESDGRTVAGLGGAGALAVSPDGSHLYATGRNDGAVAWFSTLPGGTLSWENRIDAVTVEELEGASGVVVAPDPDGLGPLGGEQVYVIGENGTVVAFDRVAGTGQLSLLATSINDEGGVAGLAGARSVTLDPTGQTLYVASRLDNAVAAFARDFDPGSPSFGRLTFLEQQRDGVSGVDGLAGAVALAASPNGRSLYVAGQRDGELAVFLRPADSRCGSVAGTGNLDILVDVGAGGQVVVEITGTVEPGATGKILNQATVTPPTGVDTNTANDSDDDEDDVRRRADLTITKTDNLITVQGLDGVSALAFAPSTGGGNVYAVAADADGLAVFARDGSDGSLSFVESFRDNVDGVDGLAGASGIAASGDGENVYAAGELDNALVVFQRDSSDGTLTELETEVNGQGGVSGILGVTAVVVSPDGKQVFAAGGGQDALAVFNRENDSASASVGALTFQQVIVDGDVQGSVTVEGIRGGAAVLAPDDSTVYVAGGGDDAIAVFSRNASTQLLTFEQVVRNGATLGGATVEGLDLVSDLAASPAGDFLVAASSGEGTLTVFQRDPADGRLTDFLQVVRNGDASGAMTVDGLAGASAVLVRGDRVYVAGRNDGAVAVFSQAGDGLVSFLGVWENGSPVNVEGLGGAAALTAGGTQLYVGGSTDDSLVAFDRSPGGSELSFIEVERQNGGGAVPGDSIEYVIVVENLGPSQVDDDFGAGGGALVSDSFPVEVVDVQWKCTNLDPGKTPTSFVVCDDTSGVGDISSRVGLPPGVRVEFRALGTVRADATGFLSNTATVTVPAGVVDFDLTNNSATDDDTGLGRSSDIRVTKVSCPREAGLVEGPGGLEDDLSACEAAEAESLVPGAEVTYWVTVHNGGPSDSPSVQVRDVLPEAVSAVEWTCVGEPVPGLLGLIEVQRDGVDGVDGVAGARHVSLSPDGRYLYAAGSGDAGVAIFRRALGGGLLSFDSFLQNGTDQGTAGAPLIVAGLQGVSTIVFSADGEDAYVASSVSDTVAHFERNVASGALTFVEVFTDDVAGVDGLGGVESLALSQDERLLFAAGTQDDALAVFTRNTATGRLTFDGQVSQGDVLASGTVSGLVAPAELRLSPDGLHLYVASRGSGAVAIFAAGGAASLDFLGSVADGQTVPGGAVDGLAGASSLALTGDGEHLYVSGRDDNAVALFERDAVDGGLTFVSSFALPPEAQGPVRVRIAEGESEVYVAGATGNGIAVLARDKMDGSLVLVGSVADGVAAVDGLAGVSSIVLSGDGNHLYAAGPGDDAVVAFAVLPGSRCSERGFGNILDTASIVDGGFVRYRAVGLLSSSTIGSITNLASAFPLGDIRDANTANNFAAATDLLTPQSDLRITKMHLESEAVPGLDLTYTVSVFNAGPSDVNGATVQDAIPLFGGPGLPGFVSGTVDWTCSADNSVSFLQSLRPGDTAGSPIVGLDGVVAVELSPDRAHLYALTGNSVVAFSRDANPSSSSFGELTFLATLTDGMPDGDGTTVEGLGGARSLASSPDGEHLYVVGQDADALIVFRRVTGAADPDYGKLLFEEVLRDGVGMVFGLDGAADVVVAPDGRHVYVASEEADAVAVFGRNNDPEDPLFGHLDWIERLKGGFGSVPLGVMDGARQIAISPDGAHVVVASWIDDALAVFERASDGTLSLLQVLKDDGALTAVPGATVVSALDFPRSLSFSPGGGHLYVASLAEDAVTVLSRDVASTSPTFGRLTQTQVLRDGIGGVTGLNGAGAVRVSPDGKTVYTLSRNDDALGVWARDVVEGSPGFGRLQLVELVTNGQSLFLEGVESVVDGLEAPSFVGVSPDGMHLYTVSQANQVLAAFGNVAVSTCTPGGSGAISDTVDLAAGSHLIYTIGGQIHPSARGMLVNTATVANPAGVLEPVTADPTDNEAVDSVDLMPISDLTLSKDDGRAVAVAGTDVTYTIEVTNAGPSDSLGATVVDLFDVGASGFVAGTIQWSCLASPGSSCTAGDEGDIDDSVNVLVDGTLTYTATGLLKPAAVGDLVNEATVVSEPAPAMDPNLADNSDSDTDGIAVITDLSITKENGVDEVFRGGAVSYTIVVANAGPSDAVLVEVEDAFPVQLMNPMWSCVPAGGATCGAGGVSSILDGVNLPVGSSITYTLSAEIAADEATDALSNTATVTPSPTATDPDLTNNVATDLDAIVDDPAVIFVDGFESGDTSAWSSALPASLLTFEVPVDSTAKRAWRRFEPRRAWKSLRGRFAFDAMATQMAERSEHVILAGGPGGFAVELGRYGGEYRIRARVQTGDEWLTSDWALLGDGEHELELHWWTSPVAGSRGGGLRLWVDGGMAADLTGVANHGATVRSVKLGAVEGVDASSRGRHRFSDMHWTNGAALGPIPRGGSR